MIYTMSEPCTLRLASPKQNTVSRRVVDSRGYYYNRYRYIVSYSTEYSSEHM